jgi:DNA-binding IclR family transcriptional regulator
MSHQSIEKALVILLAFGQENREMGTVEIGERLGIHKSTMSRILKLLLTYRFLQQNPQTKKYSLGPSIVNLARAHNQSLKTNLVHIARPHIDRLRNKIKETAILEILSGENMVMVYVAEGPRPIRLAGNVGDRVPFHAASGAKAYLAFTRKELRDTLLGGRLRRFTKNTITNRKKLDDQFERIREHGYAIDNQEIDEGTSAFGAPVLNPENKPVAAVVVAGPSQRFTGESSLPIVSALLETTARLSSQLYR